MQRRVFTMLCAGLLAAQAPDVRVGQRVNLAELGRLKGWPGGDAEQVFRRDDRGPWRAVAEPGEGKSNLGVEWDEPRDFEEIRVAAGVAPEQIAVEYWVSGWPAAEGRGGWTVTDSPWVGAWRPIRARAALEGREVVFRIEPLSAEENPNAEHRPGWRPRFRRALKLRVRFSTPTPPLVESLRVFGRSRWSEREIVLELGRGGSGRTIRGVTAYNGHVLSATMQEGRMRVRVLYTEHEPDSNDRTVLTVETGQLAFGVALDDLIREKGIYVADADVFVGDAAGGASARAFFEADRFRPGRDIYSRVATQPEQSLERATAEIPPLNMTNRRPYRHIALGFFGNREKYALLFNGNVYLSKRDSKLFKEEVAAMLWRGDALTYRIGSGEKPDFRERERSAEQRMLDEELPIALTRWRADGVEYAQEVFVTLVDAPLDAMKNRGDEPSVLMTRLVASNPTSEPRHTVVWLHVSPAERLRLRGDFLEGLGDEAGDYEAPRFRALVKSAAGKLHVSELPPEAEYRGQAVRWEATLGPGGRAELELRITLKTHRDPALLARLAALDHDAARSAVIEAWRRLLDRGMRLRVPDEPFNRLHRAALQHILISVQRDPATGLFMAPCGTLRYNMFANETNMLVRLLNMRGLHDWAALFLEPFLALQGSKPFPGRFRQTDAILHGVRVDEDHDYTHSGYNLNHGWTLWTAAEHYLFTRDRQWMRARLSKLLKAADWIISERQATMRRDPEGHKVWEYGLLPPGQLEDNEEWHHWFAVNAYAHKGLRWAARAVAELDPAQGKRLMEEAERYRQDIREAVMRSLGAAPVAPLRDGSWIPVIPPRTGLHGRDVGWIRNILYGALTLVDGEVFSPDEQPVTWILKDLEDNLFMAPWSFSVAEHDWFSRGGITLQPNLVNTPMVYLARDGIAQALRAFYNTFAASYYPDIHAFTEWLPSFGTSGGPFYKVSDEACFLAWLRMLLLREEDETLKIAFGAPRRWFTAGQHIALEDAATFFGKMSFEIRSLVHQGYVEARIHLPRDFRARRIAIRLRHPEGKKIARVEFDDARWSDVDAERDVVLIPVREGLLRVRAWF